VIEHNLDVIKTADWVIDMGPEGGSGGGAVVAEGTPEQVAGTEGSHTGMFLQPLLGLTPPVRQRAGRAAAKKATAAVSANRTKATINTEATKATAGTTATKATTATTATTGTGAAGRPRARAAAR
jgi:excinuclease ABC subunit A